jgi:SagB-type dehydrogenase family enzyme
VSEPPQPVDGDLWAEFERARKLRPAQHAVTPPASTSVYVGTRHPLQPTQPTPLASLVERRRSERAFAPPTVADLSALLGGVARLVSFGQADVGYQRSWRPYPSAGGRHPIDLAIAAGNVEGLPAGAWWFDAATLDFVRADFPAEAGLAAVHAALDVANGPPAAIFAVAHVARTLSRYPNGTSLIWRDAGVVLAMLHLQATELELSSCIIGTCGTVAFDRALGRVDVGALAVGRRRGDD